MTNREVFGLLGSLLLFGGVFAPIVSMPFVGSLNYFQNGKGDGVIILILAVISFGLVLASEFRGLWFTGLGSAAVLIFTFINFHSKMSDVRAQMDRDLAGNPFRGIADLMTLAE